MKRGLTAGQVVDAKSTRFEGPAALKVLEGMEQVLLAKGMKAQSIVLKGAGRPSDLALVTMLTGPTGNLRAPTLKARRKLLVGFNEAAWRAHFD